MSVQVVLRRPIDDGTPVELGPFARIEVRHRRLVSNAGTIAVRRTDGLWHHAGRRFVEALVRPSGRRRSVFLNLVEGWAHDERQLHPRRFTLVGDRLVAAPEEQWILSDVDDMRSWVAEDSGNAYERLIAA
jgi:hypothetical protein